MVAEAEVKVTALQEQLDAARTAYKEGQICTMGQPGGQKDDCQLPHQTGGGLPGL